jgi:replicative DNA helicase
MKQDLDIILTGKLTPQAVEYEIAVLGALLIRSTAIIEVSGTLKPEMFYKEKHAIIYDAINELNKKSEPIDLLTVSNHLRKNGKFETIGGTKYLASLTEKIASSANIEYHARIIQEKALLRNLINLSNELQKEAYNDNCDVFELIARGEMQLSNLVSFEISRILELRKGLEKMLINAGNNKIGKSIGNMPTGFSCFDKRSGGLQLSDLVIIAGETSQGKSSYAMSVIKHVAENNINVAFFSLEMSTLQLCSRLTAIQSGIPATDILYKKMTDEDFISVNDGVAKLEKLPIFIDDSGVTNFEKIISSIRLMVAKFEVKVVAIDYVQLLSMEEKGKSKEQIVGYMIRKLKNTAKELNICIIALSQLSRDRGNPYPTLSRLRDSGQIEEAADVVMFVYRPEIYNKNFPEPYENKETRGYALIDVAKGRNIGIFKFLSMFTETTTQFTDVHINDIPNLMYKQEKRVERSEDFVPSLPYVD